MVTIKQIAQEIGISPSTVSIVLGGKAAERKISKETQQKIFSAAARLGYQPNMAARSLRGGTSANELVVAMFWAQDFRASMMVRFWDGLRAEIEHCDRPVPILRPRATPNIPIPPRRRATPVRPAGAGSRRWR